MAGVRISRLYVVAALVAFCVDSAAHPAAAGLASSSIDAFLARRTSDSRWLSSQLGDRSMDAANLTASTTVTTTTFLPERSRTTAPITTTSTVSATPTGCSFSIVPRTPFVWDTSCHPGPGGVSLGCMADGIHRMCRFCGENPYDRCPESETTTSTATSTTTTTTFTVATTIITEETTPATASKSDDVALSTTTVDTVAMFTQVSTSTNLHMDLPGTSTRTSTTTSRIVARHAALAWGVRNHPTWVAICMTLVAVMTGRHN